MAKELPEQVAATIQLCSLTEDTLVEVDEDGSLVVMTRLGEFEFEADEISSVVLESLRRMALGPVSLSNVIPLHDQAGNGAVATDLAALQPVLDRLSGSVVHSLGLNDGQAPLLSVIPVGVAPPFTTHPVPAGRQVRLSRFTAMWPTNGGLMMESSLTSFGVLLSGTTAIRVASALAVSTSVSAVAADSGLAAQLVTDIVAYLTAAGVVLVSDAKARYAEDHDPDLTHWTPHELLFHRRSGTRLVGTSESAASQGEDGARSVTKPVPSGSTHWLYKPDLARVRVSEPSLTSLLETDHRCPAFSGQDIPAERIGELLYRGARVRSIGPAPLSIVANREASQRPYLSIAGLYELELYLSAYRCPGVPKGIYHYDPQGHALTLVNDEPEDLRTMLEMAMIAGAGRRVPSAVLSVTVRMERISWALGEAAYATALLHLGALQQTLYLAAKSMGLSAHPVPVDPRDRVDQILRLRSPAEVSVGECVIDLA
nr:SagB/ThcOx family dehydrogenase [Amycolatopsis palatopharyngis]